MKLLLQIINLKKKYFVKKINGHLFIMNINGEFFL